MGLTPSRTLTKPAANTSTQCSRAILIAIVFVLMYLIFCKHSQSNLEQPPQGNPGTAGAVVTELNDRLFDDNFGGMSKLVLLQAYMPNCGWCKKLKPDYQKLARDLAGDNAVVVAQINGPENRTFTSKYGVNGYPSIMLFKNGQKLADYKGARTVDAMKAFINQHR